jgi:hypothetical protein
LTCSQSYLMRTVQMSSLIEFASLSLEQNSDFC